MNKIQTIIHGDNVYQSRKLLQQYIDSFREERSKILWIKGKETSLADLHEQFGVQDLFAENQMIIIEEIHSMQKSKKKDACISFLAQSASPFILWESRILTKPMLSKFPNATVKACSISKKLFAWLESIGSDDTRKTLTLLNEALLQEDEYYCYLMLVRQIRLLIFVKETGSAPLAPFMIKKLQMQAKHFSLNELLNLHTQLHSLDIGQKTSKMPGTLRQQLDLISISG